MAGYYVNASEIYPQNPILGSLVENLRQTVRLGIAANAGDGSI